MDVRYLLTFLFLLFINQCYALPFQITVRANTTLPGNVIPGHPVKAYYTVRNNTTSVRPNNYVKYLPPYVQQITSNNTFPDTCPAIFTLEAKGQAGDSCTLELLISNTVDASDPDPHHHLFVCFPGGQTCAGPLSTKDVLRVGKSLIPAIVTIGGYTNTSNLLRPLLLTISHDVISVTSSFAPFPADFSTTGTLNTVLCRDTHCVVTGIFSTGFKPILFSESSGYSWISMSTTLPSDFSRGAILNDIACTSTNCIIAGDYIATGNVDKPMILQSPDNGFTWTSKTFSLPGDFLGAAHLNASACTGSNCIVVGSYRNNSSIIKPLIYRSTDAGLTWFNIPIGSLPPGFVSSGNFNALLCQGSSCITVGSYSTSPIIKPMVYLSTDSGATWSYSGPSDAQLPSDFVTRGFLNTVVCSNANCFAAANYNNGTIVKPLIIISGDGGVSWHAVTPVMPTDFLRDGYTLVGSCMDGRCNLVGYYVNTSLKQLPLIFHSDDDGASWHSVHPSFPTDFANLGYLDAVSCKTGICTTAGNYLTRGNIHKPLVFTSSDHGATWTPIRSVLPGDFSRGAFLNWISGPGAI